MDESRPLSQEDRSALVQAVELLETESFLIRLAAFLGTPIEAALKRLPSPALDAINKAADKALRAALATALKTTRSAERKASWDKAHKLGATLAGALGGAFGLPGAAIEIPVTTTVIFRSMLDIARSEGADISLPEVRLECLNVFAFGGPSAKDDSVETSYFAVRAGLASLSQKAAYFLATAAGKKEAAALAAKFSGYLARIAGRYAPVIGEKFAVEAVPVVGAVAGALANLAFTDFFQDKARGHFVVLRLEKEYGAARIKAEYEAIARADVIRPSKNAGR